MSELLTAAQAGEQLHVSRSTMLRLAKDGEIGHVRFHSKTLFEQHHIDAFIASHRREATTAAQTPRLRAVQANVDGGHMRNARKTAR